MNVSIQAGSVLLKGILTVPETPKGIVLFAHGSGSGRLSPRNQFVAKILQDGGHATLLMDLLTEEEEAIDERTRQFRFDIELLAQRLVDTTKWVEAQKELNRLPVGYFGASTGAAAALVAAAKLKTGIAAVVSRGGRPDLALSVIEHVTAATLLIVGGHDFGVIELNEAAYNALQSKKQLQIVKGATHLFEEAGALDEVSTLASNWFTDNFVIKK